MAISSYMCHLDPATYMHVLCSQQGKFGHGTGGCALRAQLMRMLLVINENATQCGAVHIFRKELQEPAFFSNSQALEIYAFDHRLLLQFPINCILEVLKDMCAWS